MQMYFVDCYRAKFHRASRHDLSEVLARGVEASTVLRSRAMNDDIEVFLPSRTRRAAASRVRCARVLIRCDSAAKPL